MRFRDFRVDPELYDHGAWVRFDAETEFKIAAHGNIRYEVAMIRASTARGIADRPDESEADRAARFREAEIEALPGTVLLDWRGVKADDSDEERAFSLEAAAAELRACPQFAKWVIATSHQMRHFRAKAEDAAGKA